MRSLRFSVHGSFRVIAANILVLFSAGCALRYDDAAGREHVIGFVNMTLAPAGNNPTIAGDVVDVRAIGVLVETRRDETTFAIGYTKRATAEIRNNVLVLGSPTAALDTLITGDAQ